MNEDVAQDTGVLGDQKKKSAVERQRKCRAKKRLFQETPTSESQDTDVVDLTSISKDIQESYEKIEVRKTEIEALKAIIDSPYFDESEKSKAKQKMLSYAGLN